MASNRPAQRRAAAAGLVFGCAVLYFNWPLAGIYLERSPLVGFAALFLGWILLIAMIALRAAAEHGAPPDRGEAGDA